MKTKHGGKRDGAGRHPVTEGQPKKRRFPVVTDETWDYVERVGKGNASRGIEILVERDKANANAKKIEGEYGLEKGEEAAVI